jgi:LysM repeat protein
MIVNGERSAKMTENAGEAQQAVSDAANDTESAMAKQNALNVAMYDVQRQLLNATDKLAIDGMAKLNDAMVNLAFGLYSNFSAIMGEMPESLKEMKKQMDAATIANNQAALAKKQESMTPQEREALNAKVNEVTSPEAVAAAAKEKNIDVDAGTAALAGAGTGAIAGAAIGSVVPIVGTAIGAVAGGIIGAGLGAWAAWGNDELDNITQQRNDIRESEAGKKLTEEEINTMIRANYLKQGKILDASMSSITEASATPTATGTEKPEGAATGGILSGAKSGFPATLHGTEAVVPLPDNKSIPVNLTMPKSLTRIVAQGETLSGIAIKSQTTIDAIMKANPQLTDPNKLRAGAAINIPSPPPPAAAAAIENPQAAEGGMFSGLRSGFDAILKGVQDALPTAESIEKTVTELTSTAETKSIDNVRAAMIEVRDLIKSQNELLTDLLDHTKTGVRVQKDIRSNGF